MRQQIQKSKLILVSLCVLLFAGCGLVPKNATPVDKAMIFSQQATQTYLTLYKTYKQLDKTLTGNLLIKLHTEVAPVMNHAKGILISYNNLVIQWKKSGIVDESALVKNKKVFTSLVSDVQKMLIKYTLRNK